MEEVRKALARFLGGIHVPLLAYKPRHEDKLIAARRKRNRHIKPQEPRRQSFKRFYRLNYNHKALFGMRRKQKRAVIKHWWRERKCLPS